MSNQNKGKSLLDDMQEQLGCPYLSSLREPLWIDELAGAVGGVDTADYSIDAWRSMVEYITGGSSQAGTEDAAKAELLTFLNKQRR